MLDYLNITSRKIFYLRFRDKYTVQTDYQIIRFVQKKMKGIKNAVYYISFDTFEKIRMASKAEKADSVRDYFITLRKFINYYRNHIDKMIIQNCANFYIKIYQFDEGGYPPSSN